MDKLWTFLFLLFFLAVALIVSGMSIVLMLALCALCATFIYRVDVPKYAVCLGLVSFAVRLLVIFVVKTPAESDFALLFKAAQSLLEHDFSFLDTQYFQLWSYQMGIVALHSLLLRIWNDLFILKLFNCVVSAATTVLVYLIAKEFAGEKASRLASLLYCFLPFPLFYVSVISNQFPASFLIYLGVYIFISSRIELKHWVRTLIFAVLLAVANALRPESVIPLLSAVLYLLLTIDRKNFKAHLIDAAVLVATYYALTQLISVLFVITGLAPNGLTNNAPHWKFVLGFNHDTYGRYANADTPYLRDAAAAWEVVKERIFVPISQLLTLFKKKIALFWTGSDLYWSFGYCSTTGLVFLGRTISVAKWLPILTDMSKYLAILLYILLLIGCFWYVRRSDYNNKVLLLINQVFVTFGVYLLIEIQARYAYHVQISVVILAALGIQAAARALNRKKGDSTQTDMA